MKILLIGAAGFIGPFLIRDLQRLGHSLAVFHRGNRHLPAGVTEILGDRCRLLRHREELLRFEAELVIDLILSSGKQAADLMEIFSGRARRLIALSSIDVYLACGVLHGAEPGPLEPLPLTEDSPLRSRPAYPVAVLRSLKSVFGWVDEDYDKVSVERVVMGDSNLPASVLRLPMIYGPGDPLHRFFPIVKRINDGREKILMSEDYAAWRSPRGYVENVAAAIASAATNERSASKIFNVAEENSYSALEWAKKIANSIGWLGEFVVLPREKTPRHLLIEGNLAQHWVVSSNRIREELGYHEAVIEEEALKRTIDWERVNPPSQIDPQTFDYQAEDEALLRS